MSRELDFHQMAFVCVHVFTQERPVLLVSRADGDWCLLCGDEHEQSANACRVVGIGHLLEHDPSIESIFDLPPEWEAERDSIGSPWRRTAIE